MKLQVTQENLTKALNTVARIATSRGTLPILSNVLLKTVDNQLSISATNLDIAISQYIGSKIEQEGAITVPARLMQDFVGNLPSGIINLNLTDNKLQITTDKYQSTINGVGAEDFPVMPAITDGQSWSVDASTLKAGLQQVIVAASNDEARPVLTGVYFQTVDGQLYLAATDSYRLAEKRLMATDEDINLLVPANALQDLLRVLGDNDDQVEIVHDDQQVLFRTSGVELVARMIEGKYPDYRKLIPASFATSATLKRSELTNITKVSSLFARESAGSITINVEQDQVSIHSVASQLGENTSSATADTSGEASITLNSRYLLDGLNTIPGDTITFGFNGKLEPSMLSDPAVDDYIHIVMPLKS